MEAGPRAAIAKVKAAARNVTAEPTFGTMWDILPGIVACLIVLVVPFLPDEKLSRLKLEAFEIGVFSLALIVGCQLVLFGADLNKNKSLRIAVGVWVLINSGLWFLSKEKSLATPELRRVIFASSAFFAFSFAGFSDLWKRRILICWAGAGSLLAFYGVLQSTGGIGPIQVPQMDRVIGTSGNPIFFAGFLVTTMFVTIEAISNSKILIIGLLIQGLALYHTQTRAAWLAFIAVLGLVVILRAGWKRVPLYMWGVALVGVGGFFVQTRHVWTRDQGHLLIWRDSLRMWKDFPLTGVGLGAFHTNFPTYAQADLKAKWPEGQVIINDAHNEFIQILSEAGLAGLLSFLVIPILFFLTIPFGWIPASVAAVFLQNFFSVDMRFSISLAGCFSLMGLLSSEKSEPSLNVTAPRVALATGWSAFLVAIVLPKLLLPYRAQQQVEATPNFFDQRLLDPAKTTSDLEELARQYPAEPSILEKLAYVYAKQIQLPGGKLDSVAARKAIDAYKRLIQIDPKRMAAYNNTANIYYTMGDVEQALSMWKLATEVDPTFLDAHLNLGKILYTKGRLKEAAAHFEKVLQIDPKNSEAIVYLKRMVE